ncbi:uncharacterized protein PGTG_18809 [Puccinia graminis f. sp. tritici CRL 75-36-700-3]|uniref:Uncharacterized protein n=1 Tax=Puccinia graminis f. sp. tritici (strain CRL 75-36-700-3 / race SCCL) TaxID=418459 RepID=E3L8L6_PUCGT|nr:uncharacterized protein PGTG_18809 [Puccinia graminis f. sp. tritici CRL 75-36-700-3]EFP92891.1 hypothetical protein PGTG_18809 [Puccinia graminis f. sp. tritici CRL 75-36-700-3]
MQDGFDRPERKVTAAPSRFRFLFLLNYFLHQLHLPKNQPILQNSKSSIARSPLHTYSFVILVASSLQIYPSRFNLIVIQLSLLLVQAKTSHSLSIPALPD